MVNKRKLTVDVEVGRSSLSALDVNIIEVLALESSRVVQINRDSDLCPRGRNSWNVDFDGLTLDRVEVEEEVT